MAQVDGGSSDNCNIVSRTLSNNAFSCVTVGANTVTLVVTDGSGNTASCTANITVQDVTPPTISCPSSISLNNDPGTCGAVATFATGSVAPRLYALDAQSQTIRVLDGSTFAQISSHPISVPGLTCCQSFGMATHPITGVTYAVLGSTTTRQLVSLNPATGIGTLIGNPGLQISSIAFGGTGTLYAITGNSGPTAGKLYSLNLTTGASTQVMTVPVDGGNALAYNPQDGKLYRKRCGGFERIDPVAQTVTAITVTGYNPACAFSMVYESAGTFLVNGQTNSNWARLTSSGFGTNVSPSATTYKGLIPFNLPSITANDACGTTLTQTCGLASGSTFPIGTTQNCFVASDPSGNTASCTFSVTVADLQAPTIACPSAILHPNDPGQCSAAVTFSANATDNCAVTISYSIAPGSSFPVGTSTVTATATDPGGNSASCTFTVTVNDNEAPVIECNAGGLISGPNANFANDVTLNVDPGLCTALFDYTNDVSDNCPGFTETQTAGRPSGSNFPVGTTTNTFVVTDARGNSTVCSFNVTVIDNEAPTISCPANIASGTGPGACNASVNFSVTATDNCAALVSLSHASGTQFPVGTTTVSATATDPSGNSASCTFDVTVTDNQAPNAICQNLTVVLDANDSARVEPTMVNNGSADNCGIDSLALDICNFYCQNVGATTVTLTVFDVNGNTSTCTAVVTTLDQTAPTAVCQNLTLNLDNAGFAEALAPDLDGGSFDNCELTASMCPKPHSPAPTSATTRLF
ncbi:MAG: HYR domain-containing protein [Bacteroidia bacterium]